MGCHLDRNGSVDAYGLLALRTALLCRDSTSVMTTDLVVRWRDRLKRAVVCHVQMIFGGNDDMARCGCLADQA